MCQAVENYYFDGRLVPVIFVEKGEIAPAFGLAFGNVGESGCYALVRGDLPHRVKRFVVEHELYHLKDRRQWWGGFGKELRANLIPGCRNPLGLLAFVTVTLMSGERRRFYWDRICGRTKAQ